MRVDSNFDAVPVKIGDEVMEAAAGCRLSAVTREAR
jgi:hypothetical protein